MVFNKIDAYSFVPKDPEDLMPDEGVNHVPLDELERTWMGKTGTDTVFISAVRRENIEALRHVIYDRAAGIHMQRFPYNDFLFQYYDDTIED